MWGVLRDPSVVQGALGTAQEEGESSAKEPPTVEKGPAPPPSSPPPPPSPSSSPKTPSTFTPAVASQPEKEQREQETTLREPDWKEEDCWGLESIRKILAFGDGTTRKPIKDVPTQQLVIFQHKLQVLSQTPGCFTKPHPEHTGLELDFSLEQDREAALELTHRLPGVSRWKPNLVPRLVSEKAFFTNFLGFVAATADEHFSDEKNLQYFYSDDDDTTKVPQGSSIEMQALNSKETDNERPLPPPKPAHLRMETDVTRQSVEASDQGQTAEEKVEAAEQKDASMPWTCADRFRDAMPVGATTDTLREAFVKKDVLFHLERNTNTNAVIYEANLVDGKLDEQSPVRVYWILYARDPVAEEELNFVERNSAYGSTTVKHESQPGFKVSLSALPTKPVHVWQDEKGLHATTGINGKELELISISVETTTSWGMPKVNHVDVKGRHPDGMFETERITP